MTITEVSTPCARLWVLSSRAARISQWSAVSAGPCSRCGQRSVTSGYAAFRLWKASARDEPCAPVSQHGFMSTEPGTISQRFRGDRRPRTLRGRSLELQCTPSQKRENLLAVSVVFPLFLARDLVPNPARGFPSRLQLHQPVVDLVRLGGQGQNEDLRRSVGVNSCPRHTIFGNAKSGAWNLGSPPQFGVPGTVPEVKPLCQGTCRQSA